MKFNPRLKADVARYYDSPIIVEGKKDVNTLKGLGFTRVFEIHKTGVPIRERASEIATLIDKRDKICILTNFDKRGKQLYMQLKEIFQELGVKLDSTLRGLILVGGISRIEGLADFIDKTNNENKVKKNWEVR